MQLELLSGYPDNIGRRHAWVGFGTGPTSYQQATKDIIFFPRQTFYIDAIIPALSYNPTTGVIGTYIVYGVPAPLGPLAPNGVAAGVSGVGPRLVWALKWCLASSGAEVANGTNLSGQQVQLAGFGGQY